MGIDSLKLLLTVNNVQSLGWLEECGYVGSSGMGVGSFAVSVRKSRRIVAKV